MNLLNTIRERNPNLRNASDDELKSLIRTSPEFNGMNDQQFSSLVTGEWGENQKQEEGSPGFTGGLSAGLDQMQAMGGGLMMAAGDAVKSDSLWDSGKDIYQSNMEEAGENDLGYGFTDIRGPGDAFNWARYTAGNMLPMLATSIASGGIGGAVAGTGAKMLAGTAAKQAAARIGQTAGTMAATTGMETGSIMGETEDLDVSLAHGALAGSLDALLPLQLLRKSGANELADKAASEISDGVLRDLQAQAGRSAKGAVGRGSLTGLLTEAPTEGLQGLIGQHANYWVENNGESLLANLGEADWKAVIDEGAAGGLMGTATGGPTGLIERAQSRRQVDQIEAAREQAEAEGGDALDQARAAQEAEQATMNMAPGWGDMPSNFEAPLSADRNAQGEAQDLETGEIINADFSQDPRTINDFMTEDQQRQTFGITQFEAQAMQRAAEEERAKPLADRVGTDQAQTNVVYQQDGMTITNEGDGQFAASMDGTDLQAFGRNAGEARRRLVQLSERNQPQAPVLQNRDRSDPGYIQQMEQIANAPDYDQVSASKTPDAGAPMVFPQGSAPTVNDADVGRRETITMSDGQGGTRKLNAQYAVVEADQIKASHRADGNQNTDYGRDGLVALNNGRTAGLQEAYNRGTAETYRQAMRDDAQTLGIDPAAIEGKERPVLVRLFDGTQLEGIDDPGAASNERLSADLSPSEQAQTDARRITPDVLASLQPGDPTGATNSDFVRNALSAIAGDNRKTDLRDRNGLLTAAGQKRIRSALVERAYSDETLTQELAEATDNDLKTLGDALAQSAGRWALMRERAREGSINQDMDITDALVSAVNMIRKSRQEGRSLADIAGQIDAFAGEADQMAVQILHLFYHGSNYSRIRSRETIVDALQGYIDSALQSSPAPDMFGQMATPQNTLEAQRGQIEGTQPQAATPGVQPDGASDRESGQERAGPGRNESRAQDAEASQEVAPEQAPEIELQAQTEQDLAQQEQQRQQAEQEEVQRRREEEQRAQADSEADDFTLTGSDSPIDRAEARGQGNMFDAPVESEVTNDPAGQPDAGTKWESGESRSEVHPDIIVAWPTDDLEAGFPPSITAYKEGSPADAYSMAEMNSDGTAVEVTESVVEASGQGIGRRLYESLIEFAASRGLEFHSDSELSPASQGMYRALKRDGYTVETINDPVTLDSGWIEAEAPIYRVLPPSNSQASESVSAPQPSLTDKKNRAAQNETGGDQVSQPEPSPEAIESGTQASEQLESRLSEGEAVPAAEVRQALEYIASNPESVKAELNKLTKAQLKKRYNGFAYSDTKKPELVDRVYRDMITRFRFIGSDGVIRSTAFDLDSVVQQAREHVEGLTDTQIAEYAADRKATIDQHKAELTQKLDRLRNPQTLDDFRETIRVKGMDSLTPEQRATYDRLIAENTVNRDQPAAEREGLETDGTVEMGEPTEGTHGKTGETIYNVKVVTRLGKDQFKEAAKFARSMGGGYWRGNFYLKTREDAETFRDWVKGENVDLSDRNNQRQEQQQERASDRLKAMADRLEEQAQQDLSADRKENTAKRMREADSARASAAGDARMADIMRRVAESDSALLDNMTQKVQVSLMDRLARTLKYKADRDLTETDNNGDLSFLYSVSDEQKVSAAQMPVMDMNTTMAADIAGNMQNTQGFKRDGAKLARLASTTNGNMVELDSALADKVTEYADKHAGQYEMIKDAAADYKRLKRMGITNRPTLRAALLEFMQVSDGAGRPMEQNRLQQMERDLQRTVVGNRNAFNDFFPTPESVSEEVVSQADIQPDMRVLEPSAGNGMLADAAKEAGAQVDVVEMAGQLREILTEKGHNLVGSDFLSYQPSDPYDRIVMNPPFSQDQDIQHVEHAYSMLKPGGKLVAIVSSTAGDRANNRNRQFREWLDGLDAVEQPLPQGAFMSSMNQTGVNTKIVAIEKPADAQADTTTETASDEGSNTVSAHGVTVEVPTIDEQLIQDFNRATYVASSRDLNAELRGEAESILNDLADKQHTLITDAQKAEAKTLIERYLEKRAEFARWDASHNANNPSWIVTGRSNRNMDKANRRTEKHMDQYVERVDKLERQRKRIASTLYDMRPESVKNEQAAKADQRQITQLVADIAMYMSDGRPTLEKETRKWASPKAHKAIEKALERDRAATIGHLKTIEASESVVSLGGMAKILGPRSKAAKLVRDLLSDTPSFMRKQGATTRGLSRDQVQATVDRFLKEYSGAANVEVKIHDSATTLPGFDPARDGRAQIAGQYVSKEDTVHLVRTAFDSESAVTEALQEEILVHKGLGFFKPEDREQLYRDIQQAAEQSPEVKALWDQTVHEYQPVAEYANLNEEQAGRLYAEELLGSLAQERPNWMKKGWRTLWRGIKRLLVKAGFIEPSIGTSDLRSRIDLIANAFRRGRQAGLRDFSADIQGRTVQGDAPAFARSDTMSKALQATQKALYDNRATLFDGDRYVGERTENLQDSAALTDAEADFVAGRADTENSYVESASVPLSATDAQRAIDIAANKQWFHGTNDAEMSPAFKGEQALFLADTRSEARAYAPNGSITQTRIAPRSPLFVESTDATLDMEAAQEFESLRAQGYDAIIPLDFRNVVVLSESALDGAGNAAMFSIAPQTNTPAFREWFGDSKVVDDNGEPLVVYHGTGAKFDAFDARRMGSFTRSGSAAEGFFFTDSRGLAEQFRDSAQKARLPLNDIRAAVESLPESQFEDMADSLGMVEDYYADGRDFVIDQVIEGLEEDGSAYFDDRNNFDRTLKNYIDSDLLKPGEVKAVYLSIKNPRDVTVNPETNFDDGLITREVRQAKSEGRDGLIIRGMLDTATMDDKGNNQIASDVYIAFQPEQIKSATGNTGAFDPANPDIRYKRGTAETQAAAGSIRKAISDVPELSDAQIIDSADQLPGKAQAEMQRQGVDPATVRGLYVDGDLYVVSGNIGSIQEGIEVAVHEAVGHKGIRGVLGKDLDPVMLRLYRSLPNHPKGREALAEVKREYPFLDPKKRDDRIQIAEEMLAHLLEKGHRPKAWQRAVSKIREVLRKLIPSINWTYTDVLALGEQSREYLRRNKAGKSDSALRYSIASKARRISDGDLFDDFSEADRAAAAKMGPRTAPKRIMDAWKEATHNAGLKIRQGMVDRLAGFKAMDEKLLGERMLDEDISRSSWVLGRMANAANGALHTMLHNGRVALDPEQKVIGLKDDDSKGLSSVFAQLASHNDPDSASAEVQRFMGWIAGNRARKLLDQGRENLFTEDEISAMERWDRGELADGRNRAETYEKVFAEFQAYRDDVLAIADQAGLLRKGMDEGEALLFMAQKHGVRDDLVKRVKKAQRAERMADDEDVRLMADERAGAALNELQEALAGELGIDVFDSEYDTLTTDQRDLWANEFYVPFYRINEEDDKPTGQLSTGGLSRQQAYKRLKGGTQNLNDLLENTMMNFHHLMDASLKNQAAQQAVENAQQLGMARRVPESNRDTKTSTFVLENGEKAFYQIDDPLVFQALTSLSSAGMNSTAMKVMRGFKRLFTNMTTTTPQFMVANLIRDSLQATATNEVSKNVFANVVGGGRSYRDQKVRAQMMASGASFNFGHLFGGNPDELRAQLTRDMRGAKLIDGPKAIPDALVKGWDWWNNVNNAAENVNRAAIYTQNQDKGTLKAAFESRDLIDFSAHGAWPAIRILIDIVPFLNARIQGLDKIYRSGVKPGASVLKAVFTGNDPKVSDKQAAGRFWAVTGALALATTALYLHNEDDEEYQKLEEWQKDTYWYMRFGDQAFFIPKPFEVGAIATMVERITQQFVDDEATGKLFRERIGHMVFDTFSFSPVPQAVQPVLDIYANYDAFTQRPIESMGMERLSPELRKRASTSKAGEWISQGLNNTIGALGNPETNPFALSPVQVDHLIGGYFGQVGSWVAGSGDVAWRVATGKEDPARRWYEYQPVRRFYKNLGDEDRYTRYGTVFYEGLREAGRAYADVQEMREMGRLADAAEVAESNRAMLQLRTPLNRAQRRLREINKRIDLIRRSDLDGEIKRQRIDRMRAIKNQIQRAMGERVLEARQR